MKKFVVFVLTLGLGTYLFYAPSVIATADLGHARTVTITGQPLFGWQSDWSREIAISNGQDKLTLALLEDTGWWSGSALYRNSDGAYLLDDGLDYISFTLCPLKFTMKGQTPKGEKIPQLASKTATCSVVPLETDAPVSKYHVGPESMFFLGMFLETHPGLAFRNWREADEPTPESISGGG